MEETDKKVRHEAHLTAEEWKDYQEACEDPDVGRKPKMQTERMIRKFIKDHKKKKEKSIGT